MSCPDITVLNDNEGKVSLWGNPFGDNLQQVLALGHDIKYLRLKQINMTDELVKQLCSLTQLSQLILNNCPKLTIQHMDQLHESLTNCKIEIKPCDNIKISLHTSSEGNLIIKNNDAKQGDEHEPWFQCSGKQNFGS